VLRWERHYHSHDRPFVDPATFPAVSVAMTGTHDTETLASWWDNAADDERRAFLALRSPREGATHDARTPWSDALRDELLDLAYRSGSDHVFLPLQDIFGWRDRINTPATISESNWSWRLPWPVDELARVPAAVERAEFCRTLAVASGRGDVK
jgi:4-alpha-glucanotransferase